MRVITGKFKGRRLRSLEGESVRPTGDKVKEAVFDILYSKGCLDGRFSVLDLFCGSGSLGIEALSRGAAEAVFCDNNVKSVNLTKENLKNIGVESEVICCDFAAALNRYKNTLRFDLIFLDPPYNSRLLQKAVDLILEGGILKPGGTIIAERSITDTLQTDGENLITDERRYGKTIIRLIGLKA